MNNLYDNVENNSIQFVNDAMRGFVAVAQNILLSLMEDEEYEKEQMQSIYPQTKKLLNNLNSSNHNSELNYRTHFLEDSFADNNMDTATFSIKNNATVQGNDILGIEWNPKNLAVIIIILGACFIALIYSLFELCSLRKIKMYGPSHCQQPSEYPLDIGYSEDDKVCSPPNNANENYATQLLSNYSQESENYAINGPIDDTNISSSDVYSDQASNRVKIVEIKRISSLIASGARAFLKEQYATLSIYIIIASIILGLFINVGTMIAFIVGSLTSVFCGYIGMSISVVANSKTAYQTWISLSKGFFTALKSGTIVSFVLVSIGILNLFILIYVYQLPNFLGNNLQELNYLFETVAGYGLGASSVALFGRVGGGIYTKAADIGADISGKNVYGLKEDDPRNPACIADNVGDNVGDIAGMGSDLFGSFAEATCACLVVIGNSAIIPHDKKLFSLFAYDEGDISSLGKEMSSAIFPLLISATGLFSGIITALFIKFVTIYNFSCIEKTLKKALLLSTIIQSPMMLLLSYFFLPLKFFIHGYGVAYWWGALLCMLMGLWSGFFIGLITEYFTSNHYEPVQEIAHTQTVSAATGIIYGLSLGQVSTILPVLFIAFTASLSSLICGSFGVALAALGMLSTLSVSLSIDAYGPISDNAGGIVEMADLGSCVRERSDALDAAGNTSAAIGKGFAIGSASLVSFALFKAYCIRAHIDELYLGDTWVLLGLFFGTILPYAFSAVTLKSVGSAASDMVVECMEQLRKYVELSEEPKYNKCIEIATRASLREMILPGAIVILSPILVGMFFGKNCTGGLLIGVMLTGIMLAISSSNSGGAWDNSKKYIEGGNLGEDHSSGSETHKNAVTGDTVGDPLKDTSGPSLNILMKLSAITSLIFGSLINQYFSNSSGGPIWWKAFHHM